jgi:phospholipid/cholesterol/gamma-HCH transport system substrate-binding protein
LSLFAGDERKATIAGGIVLVALMAGVAFAVFLSGRIHLGAHVRVRVYFDHVASLQEGAAVMVAGRKVGSVESIGLVPATGLPAKHPLAGTGGVVAWVRISDARRDMVPVNGDFFISSRGVLGERYLEVGPPRAGAAPERPVRDGDEVTGSSPPSLDRALQRMFDNLERARTFANAVGPEASALGDQIRALSANLAELDPGAGGWGGLALRWDAALTEAKLAWATLGEAGADPAHVEAMATSIARTTAAARQALAMLRTRAQLLGAGLDRTRAQLATGGEKLDQLRAALGRVDAITAQLDRVMAKVQAMAEAFARGEGSIARLANDPEFPEDAKALGKIMKRQPWRILGHMSQDPTPARRDPTPP